MLPSVMCPDIKDPDYRKITDPGGTHGDGVKFGGGVVCGVCTVVLGRGGGRAHLLFPDIHYKELRGGDRHTL